MSRFFHLGLVRNYSLRKEGYRREKEKGIYEGNRNLGVTKRNLQVTPRNIGLRSVLTAEAFLVDSGPPKPEPPTALPDRAGPQQSASPRPEISGPWIFAF